MAVWSAPWLLLNVVEVEEPRQRISLPGAGLPDWLLASSGMQVDDHLLLNEILSYENKVGTWMLLFYRIAIPRYKISCKIRA